jgi:hypothetical protein
MQSGVWYGDDDMRGLLAAIPALLLGSGCIYLDDPNFAPTITVHPDVEGPYYRGDAITVVADTTDRNDTALDVTYALTDEKNRELPAGSWDACLFAPPNCFVPRALGITYRMTATVVDREGAQASAYRDFAVENRAPSAHLVARGATWPENGHYRLLSPIVFAPEGSDDPDTDDRCRLTYTFETVARPLANHTDPDDCAVSDVMPGCGTPMRTLCWTPDAPGTYGVKVTVSDGRDTDTAELTIEVDGDHPPCLRQLTPAPVERIFVSRADPALTLAANVVEDDLDPFPRTGGNAAGQPAFTWWVQAPGDAAPVAVPGYAWSYYVLDQAAFAAGDEVVVRVDVADRAHAACGGDGPVCPAGADPLADCVQRVTWTLEVY